MFHYNFSPQELESQLKKKIKGQDRYVKDLSTAVWIHMQNYRAQKCAPEKNGLSYVKPNMLVLGKSGTGKTSTIQALKDILDCPVLIFDASTFTGTGWKGEDVSCIPRDIWMSARSQEEAEFAIVALDEMDKVICSDAFRGSQDSFAPTNNFLKLIEGNTYTFQTGSGEARLSTGNMLFICMGAFNGLEKVIKKRLEGDTLGFGKDKVFLSEKNLFQKAAIEDLLKYGVNEQLLGRLPVLTATNELTAADYKEILLHSEISPIQEYSNTLKNSTGVSVEIQEDAAEAIAEKVQKSKVGARGIMSEITAILQDDICAIDGNKFSKIQISYNEEKGIFSRKLGHSRKLPEPDFEIVEIEMEPFENLSDMVCEIDPENTLRIYGYAEFIYSIAELTDKDLGQTYSHAELRAAYFLLVSSLIHVNSSRLKKNLLSVWCDLDAAEGRCRDLTEKKLKAKDLPGGKEELKYLNTACRYASDKVGRSRGAAQEILNDYASQYDIVQENA